MPINGLVAEAELGAGVDEAGAGGVKAGVESGVKAGVKSGAGGVKAGDVMWLLLAGMENPKTAFAFPFIAILLCRIITPPLGPTIRSP